MAFTEQLVDGALSGFSDNRCTVRKLCCVNEKVFLVFLENGEGELEGLRYEYDPSLPTRPEQELEEKGILADFSRELEGWLEEGRVFPSVFEAFQREGAQNAVPISFSLPVAVGDKEQVQKIESLQDLGEAVGRTEGESPLAIHGFWPFAISVYWQGVQQEDGNAHRGEADVAAPVWDLVYGNAAMGLGCLGTIRDFAAISDHMPGQDMGCQVLGEGVFHALIAGVNGKSAQAELGKEFITFAIGEEEQRALNESLPASNQEFPVNQVVWKEITQKPSEDTMAEYGDIFVKLGGSFAWPGEEAFGQLEEEIAGLLHPMMEDWVVLDTVLEGAKAYSFVEKGLEDAVNGIVQKLEMYLAE